VVYLFEGYELDEENFTLSHLGERVALEPKSLRVLLLLVARRGKLIEKDAMLEAVWKDTFVEESTLTRAIALIRKQLGDDPRHPRFIETVPTLGYRFIAPIDVPSPPANLPAQWDPAVTPIETAAPEKRVEPAVTSTPLKFLKRPLIKWVVASTILLLVSAIALRLVVERKHALTEKDTIVLSDFANSTGDPVFDGTLHQGIMVQLEQSPFLSLISEERIQHTLTLMGRPTGGALTAAVAREVCQRLASTAVLEGSIAKLGSQYVLGLRAVDCRDGEVLDAEQMEAATKEDVLNVLSQIASSFRRRVGESRSMVRKHDTPLVEVMTPSLEALKIYSAGWKSLSSTGPATALPLFLRATEIDPQFAMAHAMLGRAYGDIGETVLSVKSTSRAYELRGHVSDQERFFITTSYDMVVTGNLERARQSCEAWEQTYPRELKPHIFLSGIIYPVLGRYEEAVQESKKAIEADSSFAISYNVLAGSYQALNQLQEAEQTLRQASGHSLEIPESLLNRFQLAFIRGDQATMKSISTTALKESSVEDAIVEQEAFAAAYVGYMQEAIRKSQHAVDLAQQSSESDRAAMYEAGAALREGFFGEASAAREYAAAALRLSRSRDAEYGVAFALVLAGDQSQAVTLAADLERRFPEDTAVRFNYTPTLRALLALNHGEASRAVDLLQVSMPYELGEPPSNFFGYYGALYPVYVRGEAYLTLKRGPEAVREFEKIIDHQGIVVSDPIGALAHLQLGRALVLSGDAIKAKAAYLDFLTIWKGAEPGIPILTRARAEYTNLN
jgi:DNA-binding winged helix-turn-helix (wHTH) protein/tetratricopeptide (TPR) repeat protein/TolB-like protein